MRTKLKTFISVLLISVPFILEAQVLNYNLLPLEKKAAFYAYADTADQRIIYQIKQQKSNVESLVFKLDPKKVSKNFSLKINDVDLSSTNPMVVVKAGEANDILVELVRKGALEEFVDTTNVQVLSESDMLLHDLSFIFHSNKPLKRVFVESCISVYCPYCVVQHVVYDELSGMYPDVFNGVALHVKLLQSTDPLTDFPYCEKLYDKNGVPFMSFDRSLSTRGHKQIRPVKASEPKGISLKHFEDKMKENVTTGLLGSAVFKDDKINNFEVKGAMTFYAPAATKDYTVGVAVIENHVKGTDKTYNQQNGVFSGGENGIMGGFEKLPAVISYKDIVYQQVARGFLPVFSGVKTTFPESVKKGDRIEFALNLSFPKSVEKPENARVILVVFDENGKAVNSLQMPVLAENPVANETIALPEVGVESLKGGVVVSGLVGKQVRVYSIQGYLLDERVMTSNKELITLPEGAAVVAVEGMTPKKVMVW